MKMLAEELERSFAGVGVKRTRGALNGTGTHCALQRFGVCQATEEFELVLEARLAERTRIARELHDTLLQTFASVLLKFQTVCDLLPKRPAEAKQFLASSVDQATAALAECREALQGLRSPAHDLNDLAAAIGMLHEEFTAFGGGTLPVAFRVYVQGGARPLDPMVCDETYRIAAEALRNAVKHSEATQIEVELRFGERELRLRVRDNGKGIDGSVLAQGGRRGRYGLCGMHERAELVSGKLTVWSARRAGTEVDLTIPASRAYLAARPPHC